MEAIAKHDFQATADDELSFYRGAKLKVCCSKYLHIVTMVRLWRFELDCQNPAVLNVKASVSYNYRVLPVSWRWQKCHFHCKYSPWGLDQLAIKHFLRDMICRISRYKWAWFYFTWPSTDSPLCDSCYFVNVSETLKFSPKSMKQISQNLLKRRMINGILS